MNSYFQIGLLVVAGLCGLYGIAQAQHPACLEISKCVGSDFGNTIRNKDKDMNRMCRQFKETIDCMNPKLAACLPSIDASLAASFTSQRDVMQKNLDTKCKGQPGVATSSGCNPSALTKCNTQMASIAQSAGQGKTAICNMIASVKQCLEAAKCTSPDVMKGLHSIQGQMGVTCDGDSDMSMGKKDDHDHSSNTEGGKGQSGNSAAEKAPENGLMACDTTKCMGKEDCEMHKCFSTLKDKCKDMWKGLYMGEFKKKFDSIGETCGCGSLKPSLLIVLTTAILIFIGSRF